MLGIARELRTTLWLADALSELGQDLVAAGEIADGTRHLVEAIQAAHEAVQFSVRPGVALTEVALRTGQPAEALGHLGAWSSSPPNSPCTCSMRAGLRARRSWPWGARGEGEARIREVKAEAAALGAAPSGWRASLALARLYDATGRMDDARAARADARRLLDKVATGLTGVPELLRGFKATAAYREATVS